MKGVREIYLDNAATTKTSDKVMKKIIDMCTEFYGNPSSMHNKGLESDNMIREAAQIVSKAILCSEDDIYFTSGGTEANNMAIRGVSKANKKRGNHIITTEIEHSSVRNVYRSLEEEGFRVTYLNVDKEGYVNEDELKNAVNDDTILVSIMYVNNEIGTKQNIEKLGNIIKNKNSKTYFHVDAIQAFGKYVINVDREKIDLMSISGHKIHAPKGIGALYVRKGVKITPIIYGGGQEGGMRSGTENTSGIVALGETTKETYKNLKVNTEKMVEFKTKLVSELFKKVSDVYVNGPDIEKSAPHILSLRFKDIKGEALLHSLSDVGIYISMGSACAAKKHDLSKTLSSIGLTENEIYGTVRLSFSPDNYVDDIPYIVDNIATAVEKIRKVLKG
ncbi:MAG TPA: cysteine desulfurase NifS [Clostridiales bacterium]|nr:MAG: cysteine desulfurase NifS [Clostridiales bacterium GWD2_32_19]HCC07124.1 cysteine desulfurase NifS [Clostridiales bacterium]